MPNKITSFIPNLITLCNLLSGCVAIFFSFHQGETFGQLTRLQWAWIAIAAAAVFDFSDGASARCLHAYSEIGVQLDSLSDLVSFGVAPAMMMFNLMLGYSAYPWLCAATLLIPACGAYRLAKFNCDKSQSTSFKGLPIPANAIFWIGMCGWIERYSYPGTAVMVILIVLVSWLMVCNMRMFSLKFKNFYFRENFRRYVLIAATATFCICWGVAGLVWAIALYVFISMLGRKEDTAQ